MWTFDIRTKDFFSVLGGRACSPCKGRLLRWCCLKKKERVQLEWLIYHISGGEKTRKQRKNRPKNRGDRGNIWRCCRVIRLFCSHHLSPTCGGAQRSQLITPRHLEREREREWVCVCVFAMAGYTSPPTRSIRLRAIIRECNT